MSQLKNLSNLCISASMIFSPLFSSAQTPTAPAKTFERPPQFIMFAFDGSKSVPMWKETREYAKSMTAAKKPLKFTYFINTSYLIHHNNRKMNVPEWNNQPIYKAPQLPAGASAIGYACSGSVDKGCGLDDISQRADQMSRAFLEKHEIASHAVGHFDANGGMVGGNKYTKWSYEDWISEHTQFFNLLFNGLKVQNIPALNFAPTGMAFKRSNLVGFRAPQLGIGNGFNEALKANSFKYDTSRVAADVYWPEKLAASKAWNFPLAVIPVYRPDGPRLQTLGKTLAMDYNFCVFQTQKASGKVTGNCDTYPERTTQFRDEMYTSYMQYFLKLYTGNRAPIQIGHHFSKWNNGAYWDAMKQFADSVCGLPDVKCVIYEDYLKWIDKLSPEALKFYRTFKGSWGKKPTNLAAVKIERDYIPSVKLALIKDDIASITAPGLRQQGYRTKIELNGQFLSNDRISVRSLEERVERGETEVVVTAKLVNAKGQIVNQSMHLVKDLGLSTIRLDSQSIDQKHLTGDLEGAHKE